MQTRLLLAAVLAAGMSLWNTTVVHADHPSGGGQREEAGHHRGPRHGSVSFPMSGAEVPDGGDPAGRGRALLRLDSEADVVCLQSDWRDLAGRVTGIHIHRGAEGETGPHQIDLLGDESLAGDANRVEMCVQVAGADESQAGGGDHHAHSAMDHGDGQSTRSDPIQEILDDPAGFYLNVHSTEYPGGAIRGQLDH